jgi:hypothetical protein
MQNVRASLLITFILLSATILFPNQNIDSIVINNNAVNKNQTLKRIIIPTLIGAGIGLIIGIPADYIDGYARGMSPDGSKPEYFTIKFTITGAVIGSLIGIGSNLREKK